MQRPKEIAGLVVVATAKRSRKVWRIGRGRTGRPPLAQTRCGTGVTCSGGRTDSPDKERLSLPAAGDIKTLISSFSRGRFGLGVRYVGKIEN